MGLLTEREKTLNRNLALVMKELAGVKGQNVSFWWSRGNVGDKIEALEANVGSALKVVTDSGQQNVTQVARSVESAFSEHRKRLMEQARWTKAQIANNLKTSVTCFDADFHRKVAKCATTLSIRLSAIKAACSEVAHRCS